MNKGFTLIELVVTIAIIAILSGVILFSVSQYINTGKDSNISGNLAILIPAGEVFYNGNNNSYTGFCDPTQGSGNVLNNILSQMPLQSLHAPCYGKSITPSLNPQGVCCREAGDSWFACARKFADPNSAYCVDSRGMKKDIPTSSCMQTGGQKRPSGPQSTTMQCP